MVLCYHLTCSFKIFIDVFAIRLQSKTKAVTCSQFISMLPYSIEEINQFKKKNTTSVNNSWKSSGPGHKLVTGCFGRDWIASLQKQTNCRPVVFCPYLKCCEKWISTAFDHQKRLRKAIKECKNWIASNDLLLSQIFEKKTLSCLQISASHSG